MAIISCPECGRQVSDKALKCPQCAHPIANPETRDQLLPPKPLQKEPENIAKKWITLTGTAVLVVVAFLAIKNTVGMFSNMNSTEDEFQKILSSKSSNSSSATNETTNIEKLPPHTVASRVSLGSNGERIQVNSLDPQLSKGDCEKLADNYKPQSGQISVHKPSLKFKKLFPKATEDQLIQPFCVNNLDGKGIFFTDGYF
jgi:hypothetical protein